MNAEKKAKSNYLGKTLSTGPKINTRTNSIHSKIPMP